MKGSKQPYNAAMPEETSATDRYLAEVDRLLGLRGRERRRALEATRRRLATVLKEEHQGGAGEAEADNRALARIGSPKQLAEELEQRSLTNRARSQAQIVLAAFIPIALATLAIALEVAQMRHFRFRDDFFHYYSALGIALPPLYLAVKLAAAVVLIVAALLLAEFALAFTRRRRRLSAALTLAGALALIAAVSIQIAFAFEWRRLQRGHGAWLAAAMAIEVGAVLILAFFLARPARVVLTGRLAPLASVPALVLLALALPLAVGAKSGFSSTDRCERFGDGCAASPEMVVEHMINSPVWLDLPTGPRGSQGAVALKGRRLAFAATVWRVNTGASRYNPVQPDSFTEFRGASKGPADLTVWEGRWSRAVLGPCGADPGCDILFPPSYHQVSPSKRVSWRLVARFKRAEAGALAVAYRSNGGLAIAYSRRDGTWLAQAPSWHPRRLFAASARSIKLVSLANGDLLLAAATGPAGAGLELVRLRSAGRSISTVISGIRSRLRMVAAGSTVVLLARDGAGRLVLERRRAADLSLIARRSFGRRTQGALGNLHGDAIGIAIAKPRSRNTAQLEIFSARRDRLALLSRERITTEQKSGNTVAVAPVTIEGSAAEASEQPVDLNNLVAVVQTGEVVRALFSPEYAFHTSRHITFMAAPSSSALASFASDWPRFATLWRTAETPEPTGQPDQEWTSFELVFGQPSRQLLLARTAFP